MRAYCYVLAIASYGYMAVNALPQLHVKLPGEALWGMLLLKRALRREEA